jgi:hypothetical protein
MGPSAQMPSEVFMPRPSITREFGRRVVKEVL